MEGFEGFSEESAFPLTFQNPTLQGMLNPCRNANGTFGTGSVGSRLSLGNQKR